jgi:hypothetical protein
MRRVAVALAAAGVLAACAVASAAEPSQLIRTNNSGGNAVAINEIAGTPCWRQGQFTYRPAGVPFSDCTAPIASTTTSTVAPTTTSTTSVAPTTTLADTTTTAPPPTTIPSGPQFVETFDGNTGLQRFDYGVHHRDDLAWADTWSADHDLACGSPATQRTVSRFDPGESFYLCADHLMTSVGDASSYSVAWFEPKQTFTRGAVTKVSWDVNVTDLGSRQWWEAMIVPAAYESGIADCPHCAVHWSLSPSPSNLPPYPDQTSVIGLGPLGGDGNFVPDDEWEDIFGHCHTYDCIDVEGAGSKQIRRTFWMRDNLDGTLTFHYFGSEYTRPGSFPAEFRVVFKDHNYTPSKDGTPVGFTWHWDNIAVT